MTNLLHAENLCCARQHKIIFKDINFTLAEGEGLFVSGANGSGKSSLLQLLAGLSLPMDGEIYWQDQSIFHSYANYKTHLHFITHANGIKLGLTVNENLLLAEQLALTSRNAIKEVLEKLNLLDQQHSKTQFLSAGQKRRVSLAKLLLIPKKLWLLDEPLTALDQDTQNLFQAHLEQHLLNGGMVVMSSHHSINLKNATLKSLRLG